MIEFSLFSLSLSLEEYHTEVYLSKYSEMFYVGNGKFTAILPFNQTLNIYVGVEVQLCAFLTLAR